MFQKFLLIGMILVGLSCAHPTAAATAPQASPVSQWLFVEPVRFHNAQDDLYRAIVADVFADDDGSLGGCFSMVTLIEGGPEEIVYADCSSEGTQAAASVVHIVAVESIREKLMHSGVEQARSIKVHRTEATLSAKDSRLLRDVWIRMLGRAQVETGTRIREHRQDYFFSAFRVGVFQGRIGGVAKNPGQGTPAAKMVELGALLSRLADSEEGKRPEFLSSIRTKATELIRAVDRGRK